MYLTPGLSYIHQMSGCLVVGKKKPYPYQEVMVFHDFDTSFHTWI